MANACVWPLSVLPVAIVVSKFPAVASHFADWACGRRASGIFPATFLRCPPTYFLRRAPAASVVGNLAAWAGAVGGMLIAGNRGSILQWNRAQLYDSVFFAA